MYYILNETNRIIAADDSLLTVCGVTHIDELTSEIVKGDIYLTLDSDNEVTLKKDSEVKLFTAIQTSLSSLLGHLTLVTLSTSTHEETMLPTPEDEVGDLFEELEEDLLETPDKESALVLDEDPMEDEITFGDHITIDDDLLNSKVEETITIEDENNDEDSEIFDLLADPVTNEEESSLLSEETEVEPFSINMDDSDDLFIDTPKKTEIEDIIINVEEVSQKIGISTEDYNNFLNEFIDTALGLEKDLQSQDDEKQSSAVDTLTYLSDVLHLPNIGDILKSTQAVSGESQREIIESFYATLSRISTTQEEVTTAVDEDTKEIDFTPSIDESALELFDEPEVTTEVTSIQPPKAPSTNSFGTINLDDVQAKHFDFQLEEAANDLSLPVELIEEFVHDFISQAHVETKKMLKAYEEGDLDAIQKIGHLLKGASSNLRINPLSDTLYQIQFCEDNKNLEALIKDYWAHFLSFENQINVISN